MQTPQPRTIPQPVLYARMALDTMRAEGLEVTSGLEKALPAYALNLARAGQAVTVEGLLVAARQGEAYLKSPTVVRKTEDPLLAYERIVKGFDRYKGKTSEEQLILAAELGDNKKIKLLMERGADPTAQDNLAITRAAENGHNDTVRLLIAYGADPTAQNNLAIIRAAQNGHSDTVRLLLEHGADPTAQDNNAIRWAAVSGHKDTVQLLLEHGADPTSQNSFGLIWAAQNGHNDTVRLLLEHGADATAQDNKSIICAARYGYSDTVRLLLEHGADPRAQDNKSIIRAAENGHSDTVRLLLEYGDPTAQDNMAIIKATRNGHTDVVRLLLDHGADLNYINSNDETLLLFAAENGHTETCRLLVERGADINFMSKDQWSPLFLSLRRGHYDTAEMLLDLGAVHCAKSLALEPDYNLYKEGLRCWQKTLRMEPPRGLALENPAFFKKTCFETVVRILAKEGHEDKEANIMAFHTAGLFQSENRVLQYLAQWGEAGNQPLHDLVQMIKLPKEGSPNLKDWGDAVLKCGPSMAKLVKFGDKISSPMKSLDGKTWSMVNTRAECAKFSFKRAAEHPVLAAVCFEHDVDEDGFNKALKLVQKTKPEDKTVPDIVIEGSKFGAEGSRFYRLPANDIRGLFLGEMTDCCQSIGNAGGACAEHGYTSKDSGFYVVENAKGRIVGQTWAWRGDKGEMCFDSLETLGNNVTPDQWQKILQETAKELTARKDHDINALHVGAGGATPVSSLRQHFTKSATATPKDYTGYRDSKSEQIRVWKRGI